MSAAKVTCLRGHAWEPDAQECRACKIDKDRRRRRGLSVAPKTHWYCGHEREGNTYVEPGTGREICRACKGARRARYYRETPRASRAGLPRDLEREREYDHKRRDRLRDEVTAAYGGKCADCGQPGRLGSGPDSLQLDHVAGDGSAHRRSLGDQSFSGVRMYAWAKRNGYPRSLQLLCVPCHATKTARDRERNSHVATATR